MSIETKYLNSLKDHFIYNSEIYKTSEKRISELCDGMINIIISESLKDITKEELKFLNNFDEFWINTCIYLGRSFRIKYGGIKLTEEDIGDVRGLYCDDYYRRFKIPKLFFEKSSNLSILPDNIVSNLIKMNDEILRLKNETSKIILSWDRLINKDTSKTWLKQNFPEIYEKLRELEKDIPV